MAFETCMMALKSDLSEVPEAKMHHSKNSKGEESMASNK